jgi:hypothetical protein
LILETNSQTLKALREASQTAGRSRKVETLMLMRDVARRAMGEDVHVDNEKLSAIVGEEVKKERQKLDAAKTSEERLRIANRIARLSRASSPKVDPNLGLTPEVQAEIQQAISDLNKAKTNKEKRALRLRITQLRSRDQLSRR